MLSTLGLTSFLWKKVERTCKKSNCDSQLRLISVCCCCRAHAVMKEWDQLSLLCADSHNAEIGSLHSSPDTATHQVCSLRKMSHLCSASQSGGNTCTMGYRIKQHKGNTAKSPWQLSQEPFLPNTLYGLQNSMQARQITCSALVSSQSTPRFISAVWLLCWRLLTGTNFS